MLKKLLKYDLIWIDKFLMFYAAAPLIALAFERITTYMVNTHPATLWTILNRIAVNVLISAIASFLISAFVRSIARFSQTVYKDASYLTHTLPVKRGTVYTEKFLAGLISMVGTMAVCGLCFLVASVPGDMWGSFFALFRRGDVWGFAILAVLCMALELAFALLVTMFGFVVGQRAVKGKTWRSVLLSVGLYLCIQSVLAACIITVIRSVTNMRTYFFEVSFSSDTPFNMINQVFGIACGAYLLVNSLLFFFGRKLFCKGVNVE